MSHETGWCAIHKSGLQIAKHLQEYLQAGRVARLRLEKRTSATQDFSFRTARSALYCGARAG